jgi:hypothetical protein
MANNATNVNPISVPFNHGPLTPEALPRDNGLYTASATQLFEPGTKCEDWRGRLWRYAKAGVAITNAYLDYALYFNIGPRNKWYEHPTKGQSSGDMEITLPFDEAYTNAGATVAVAKDELRGGTIVIYKDGVANQCIRQIVGNTVGAAATPYAVTIYLDGPLPYDVVVADGVELIANEWSDVRPAFASASNTHTMCGYALVTCAAYDYIWVQRKGLMRVSQAAAPTDYERLLYCSTNGNCSHRGDIGTGVTDQFAGTLVIPGTSQSAFLELKFE